MGYFVTVPTRRAGMVSWSAANFIGNSTLRACFLFVGAHASATG